MLARPSPTIAALAAALVLALAATAWLAADRVVAHLAGTGDRAPEDAEWVLSESARALVEAAYADVGDDAVIVDHRVHVLSMGQRPAPKGTNRSFINAEWRSWYRPLRALRAAVWFEAAGMRGPGAADDRYLARLLRAARALPRRHRLYLTAMDQRYDAQGRPQPEATPFAVDNDYVWSLAQAYPDRFEPVISVHPYRRHAQAELTRWANRGVEAVAWMPVMQGIDPDDPRLLSYYRALADHGMTLYTHTGAGVGLGAGDPAHGNPMRYRRALEAGVDVVMIHAAASGRYPDPQSDGRVSGTELFLRLLRRPEYVGQLRGAIAGVAARGRTDGALAALLQNPELHDRLVYASGYPLPAVKTAIDTGALAAQGFLTTDQARALNEIRAVNPLLFDFVLNRSLRLPHTDLGLPAAVFTGNGDTETDQ